MSPREVPDSLIFKLMVVRELHRLGHVSINEFPGLVSRVAQYLNSMGYSANPSDVIHLLDVISIDGGKVSLNSEGIHYLRILEVLTNYIAKSP